MKPMQYMHYEPSIYTALANPLCVRALLFFARPERLKFAHFVWNVIDHMRDPELFWALLNAKMRS